MNIKINNKINFNYNKPPLIIAEISCNHNGKKNSFLKHIFKAAKSGADLIKIQSYEPVDMTFKSMDKKFIINKGLWKKKNLWNLYKKAQTPFKWHEEAFNLSKKMNVPIFSTPFSARAVDLLEKLKTPLYKIASFEITDLKLIERIAKTRKPVIVSTGMARLNEINRAVNLIKKYHNKIILFYCVSGYPTPENEVNLLNIQLFKEKFPKLLIGISDHTNSINSSLASTILGVVAIEKHFKISNNIKSEDSKFSINAEELSKLKKLSKIYYDMRGKKAFQIKKSEYNSKIFRRSIFSTKKIIRGEKFSKENIETYRPNIGLCASIYFKIIGKKSTKTLEKFTPIRKTYIQ
jgi:pseudaminic acid synthase